ncbi:hypothetical protein EC968_010176 [Mortierella alpina]|nr:hypothetical protein EC968_010176 [Mortierella alpina]
MFPSLPVFQIQSKSGSTNLVERQEAEEESAQDEESGATEESNNDMEQKSSAPSGLVPLGQALEDMTKSSDGSDTSSPENATDSASTTTTPPAEDEQPSSTSEESSEPTETPESQDSSSSGSSSTVPPTTDPVASISSDDGSDNIGGDDPNGPQKVAPTTSESPEAAGAAQPTSTTTTHSANADTTSEAANNESTKTSIMIGVVAAALLLAAALCVWIFRKLKLSPSRQFRGKMGHGGGGAAGGVHARNNYGPGHEDGSDYNSYDEFYRGPESPLPMMAHAAGPSVIGGMAMSSSAHATATDGVGPYPSQNLAHMSLSSESMTDYNQYSYGDGYDMTHALAGSAGLAVLPMVPPSTVGGLPVVGHNVHKYGSEDFSQNTHFLRELRE